MEDVQLVMVSRVEMPSFEDLMIIMGFSVYEDFHLEASKEEGEAHDNNLKALWSFEDSELLELDLYKGYTIEKLVFKYKPESRYFEAELTYIAEEGYSEEESELNWKEVEPVETTIIKFIEKRDGKTD